MKRVAVLFTLAALLAPARCNNSTTPDAPECVTVSQGTGVHVSPVPCTKRG